MDPVTLSSRSVGANPLGIPPGASTEEKLKAVSQEFEAILLNYLLKSMRSTVPDSGWMKRSLGRELYEQVMDEELARKIARTRGVGIGEMLYRELSRAIQSPAVTPSKALSEGR